MERRKVLQALGAKLILTDGAMGMGRIDRTCGGKWSRKIRIIMCCCNSSKNPANPEIHVKTTGPEIWDDTNGNVDALGRRHRNRRHHHRYFAVL